MKKQKALKALPSKKFIDVVDEHNAATAGRNPERAREALLAGNVEVAGLTIHAASIGIQILLEDINHPILQVFKCTKLEEAHAIPISGRDVLNLVFIFTNPEEAWRTAGLSRENFNAAARDFAFSIPSSVLGEVMPVITNMLFKSGRTVPGSASNAEGGADDPLAQSQRPAQG